MPDKSHDHVNETIRYKEEKKTFKKSFKNGNFPLKYYDKDLLSLVEARFRRV